MNKLSSEKSGTTGKIFGPLIGLTVVGGAGYGMLRHADKTIDAAIGEQRNKQGNEEAVRRALSQVEKDFCKVCEGGEFKRTPIEELPLQPFVDTKNQIMAVMKKSGTAQAHSRDVRLTCETFAEGRKGVVSFSGQGFNAKRVQFCDQHSEKPQEKPQALRSIYSQHGKRGQ